VKKVVVTGSESTGKTELARRLGEHFKAPVSEEFVRRFAASKVEKIDFNDHGMIAKGQIVSENLAILQARDLVILDTDLVSTVAYCEHYFGRCPEWIADEARERAGDLYLLCATDVPWVADGVRDRPDRRDEMHALFAAKLKAMRLRWVDIAGERDARFDRARQAIESLMAGGAGTST
jgi:NadR type nicotinamide-nucleotide adenylyltransferase